MSFYVRTFGQDAVEKERSDGIDLGFCKDTSIVLNSGIMSNFPEELL